MVMAIAVDAMGGDKGPEITVPGTLAVLQETKDLEIVLIGDEDRIKDQLHSITPSISKRLHVQHATQTIEMDDPPAKVLRQKRDSSLHKAITMVNHGDVKACVSAGNTGALMAVSLVFLKTFPGINRPAIISQIPTIRGHVSLLDLGANVGCSAEDLFKFGIMGSTFVQYMEENPNPRVALLNIGIEEIKGDQVIKKAAELFRASDLNFQGYVEGDGIFTEDLDVIVCDGFAGNVAIKTMEGVSKFIQNVLRNEFRQNSFRKLAAILARPTLQGVKTRIDPRVFNGATLIGLRGIVIKSHGGADSVAFSYALRKALSEVANDVPSKIRAEVSLAVGATA